MQFHLRLYAAIILMLVLILGLSYGSASIALRAYNSWVNYENPYLDVLARVKPVDISDEPLARHVVFVLLDGLSVYVLEDLIKNDANISRLASLGALYVNGLANMPSYSIPARASILSGTSPDVNGVSSNDYKGVLMVDSLPVIAKNQGYKILCSGDSSIEMLFSNIMDECTSVSEGAGHGALSLNYGLRLLREYATKGDKVFLWIGVADVDMIGHKAGGLSKEYNESSRNILYLVLDFILKLEEEGLTGDTLLVILNDHGFKKMGHHGGPELEVRRVLLLLIGPGVKPGVYYTPFTHNDIAPTISMLMGWRIPSSSTGSVISEGLNLPSKRLEAYIKASEEQRRRLVEAMTNASGLELSYSYEELVESLAGRGSSLRLIQALAILAILILTLLLFIRVTSLRGLLRELPILIVLVVVYETVFWIYYRFSGGPVSLSDIYSFGEFISKIQYTVLMASLVASFLLGVLELTPYRRGFRANAPLVLSMILAIIVLSIAYATPFYVSYGSTVRFPFPDWNGAVFFFLSLMKASLTGFVGLGLSMVIVAVFSLIGLVIYRRHGS